MLHIKKIKPLFNNIITTAEKYEEDIISNGLIETNKNKGDLKMYQKVIAVGSTVRDIEVGDTVMINPMNYAVRRYDKNSIQNDIDNNPVLEFQFNWLTIDNENGEPQDCLMFSDRDILYTFEGDEVSEPILMPNKPQIIC